MNNWQWGIPITDRCSRASTSGHEWTSNWPASWPLFPQGKPFSSWLTSSVWRQILLDGQAIHLSLSVSLLMESRRRLCCFLKAAEEPATRWCKEGKWVFLSWTTDGEIHRAMICYACQEKQSSHYWPLYKPTTELQPASVYLRTTSLYMAPTCCSSCRRRRRVRVAWLFFCLVSFSNTSLLSSW
jgi:hypothetical protein